jgi:hypothetical protein
MKLLFGPAVSIVRSGHGTLLGDAVKTVPWARARSRYTRDFEDVVAWLAQQIAKKPIAGLLRIAWDSVRSDR